MTLNHLSSQPVSLAETVAPAGWTTPSSGMHALGASGAVGTLSPSAVPPVDLHPALQTVRQMPEFQPPQPSWLDQLWKQPVFKKLSHEISRLLHQAWTNFWGWLSKLKPVNMKHLPSHMQDWFSVLVGVILILVGLFVLYLVLGWLVRWRENSARKPLPPARFLETVLLVNAEHHYQQAQLAANTGDFEQALRQLYMATLCLLDEQKLAPYEATRTNLEYLALLAEGFTSGRAIKAGQHAGVTVQDASAMQEAFARMARQFESVRFGLRPISLGQFEQSRADYQIMLDMAAITASSLEGRVHG